MCCICDADRHAGGYYRNHFRCTTHSASRKSWEKNRHSHQIRCLIHHCHRCKKWRCSDSYTPVQRTFRWEIYYTGYYTTSGLGGEEYAGEVLAPSVFG
jgi:hypothetical protein